MTFPAFCAEPSPGLGAGSYLSVLFSLVILVGIIIGLAMILRRFNITQSGSEQMKVVSSMIVGSRERVLIVQVGEEQHMLGITAHNINHLAKLDTQLEHVEPGKEFKQKLAMFMGKKHMTEDGNKESQRD